MARYIKLDQDKINRLKREAQQFQDDIVCSVGTDFMQKIAEAENRMIFDILKGLEDDSSADVVPKDVLDQVRWERRVAIKQLEEIGLSFGEKTDGYGNLTEFAREIFEEIERDGNYALIFCEKHIDNEEIRQAKLECYKDIQNYVAELKKKYTKEGE